MTRYALSALFFLALVMTAAGQPAPPDLRGKALAEGFGELLADMGSADNGARTTAQQRWQNICFSLGAPGHEKLRAEACGLMGMKLDANTPALARLWLLQQLQRLGGDESVDAIARVMDDTDDELREAAVRALANNPSAKATGKLTDKLAGSTGKAKIGLLNALGHRGDPHAITAVANELSGSAESAIAAARALGRIPGEDSVKTLARAKVGAKAIVRPAFADALLVHADRFLKAGKTAEANTIYEALTGADEVRSVRFAALRGQLQAGGDKAGELVLTILAGEDRGARAIALGQIENLSANALKSVTANLEKLPVACRVSVITAIAARGDRTQVTVALSAANSADADLKRAGMVALGRLGDAGTVEFLLDVMSGKNANADIAAESLAALAAEGVNEKLISVLKTEPSSARSVLLIGILERRKATAAVPMLLRAAAGEDVAVRSAAFRGLKSLAAPEHIAGMVTALPKTTKGKERETAELAISVVASQITPPEKRAEPVLAAIKAGGQEQAADLLPLLGRLGGVDALNVIREALASTETTLHAAAADGICNWPDTRANDDLLALTAQGKTGAEKRKALNALIRVNAVLIERTDDERIAALSTMKKAMELATDDDQRRAILEGLGNIRHIDTLRYLASYLDQPALVQAACKGVVELAHSKKLREPNKAEFGKLLDRVIAICKDNGLVERAKSYKTAQ